jgi:hypothetical protein
MADKQEQVSGALVFWLVLIATAIIPLLYLQVWAYQNINMKAFIVGNIFVVFILFTFAFDFQKRLYPSKSSFLANCFSLTIGIGFGTILGFLSSLNQQSVLGLFTVSQQYLLSEISAQLPLFWSTFANTVGAPVAEELLFLISIPTILFIILEFAGRKYKLFKNALVQTAIVAGVVGPLFAFFHVGNIALFGFIISAIIFRVLTIAIVYGDQKSDLIPLISIIPAFGVGYHIANNVMSSGGWGFFIQTMFLDVFGIVFLSVLTIFLASGIWYAAGKSFGLEKTGKRKRK